MNPTRLLRATFLPVVLVLLTPADSSGPPMSARAMLVSPDPWLPPRLARPVPIDLAAEPEWPRWPTGWPALDPLPESGGNPSGAQDMVSGDLDVTVPFIAGEPVSDDPPPPDEAGRAPAETPETPATPAPPADRPTVQGAANDFGTIPAGEKDRRWIAPEFDLEGSHRFRVTIRDAPWVTPDQDEVELRGDGSGFIDLDIDTNGLRPGNYAGTAVLTCVDHPTSPVVEIPLTIRVPHPPHFGAHPSDGQFGGLDASGQPQPVEDLITQVIEDIAASPFGQTVNGRSIVEELRTWDGHFDIVVTTDGSEKPGRLPEPVFGTAPDGDAIRPGEGQYVLSRRRGPIGYFLTSEEFFLGVDQSSKGIDNARQSPGDYYVFTYEGKMGVVSKADLAHTLPHEGLHAHQGGANNVNRQAPLQEELDGFRAGNAAAESMGLPPQSDAPRYGSDNPDYEPLFPPPAPAPPSVPRAPPEDQPDPNALPEGYSYASAAPARDVPLLDSPDGSANDGSAFRTFEGLEVVVASRGGSTGPVLDLLVVNHGSTPVRLHGEGIVLEPVDEPLPQDLARIDEIRAALSAGKPVPERDRLVPGGAARPGDRPRLEAANVIRVTLEGYCLELQRDAPAEGTLFRIAARDRQAAFSAARAILEASRSMNDERRLRPDSDPVAYYHSIRQWAIWVQEERLDRAGFEKAFVEHARKNLERSGRSWTAEIDRLVRDLVPNRWEDLTAIHERAGLRAPEGGR